MIEDSRNGTPSVALVVAAGVTPIALWRVVERVAGQFEPAGYPWAVSAVAPAETHAEDVAVPAGEYLMQLMASVLDVPWCSLSRA